MSCLYVYCPHCRAERDYRKPATCPVCGARMEVEFDEELDAGKARAEKGLRTAR